ncbi:MAG: cysteine--tRNA ligase [Candidatus Moranbacteria bacterium]|nr:cysteine--tRNA ligase [Candidatus Moranbacteria bacterium]
MLKLYNTLTQKKEVFESIETGKVKMYNCGPTVYDYSHIGNLRTFIFADTLRRHLETIGYEVRQIMNITDVGHLTADDLSQADTGEDKMLKASRREKKTPQDVANFYTEKFFEDLEKLNFKKAHFFPRATTHIPQIIKMVETLIEKGLAYEKNGNVFYDVTKFKDYGKLSKKKLADLKENARLEKHPDKKHGYDFALWLKAPKEHLLKWKSPWSLGYPGWHIECSAMSIEYLGETMDIHTGGEDHIFPHHENEIAQSEGCTEKEFSKFWLHTRFLLVDSQKMSKSKNNFYILKDILDKGFSAMDFRFMMLSSHYRSSLNFTWDGLQQASANFKKISRFISRLQEFQIKSEEASKIDPKKYLEYFDEAINDDLNTPKALSILFEMISEANKEMDAGQLSPKNLALLKNTWNKMNSDLGIEIEKKKSSQIPNEIIDLAEERVQARKEKDFEKADEIRKKIGKEGYTLDDMPNGTYGIIEK